MKKSNLFFLIGFASVFLFCISILDISTIEAISDGYALSRLPRELRLGVDLGLIQFSDIRRKVIDRPISRRNFSVILHRALQLVGVPLSSEISDLSRMGLFKHTPSNSRVTRREGIETLARILLYLNENRNLQLPRETSMSFKDYKPAPKYYGPFEFMRKNEIAKGYPNGSFKPGREITLRESVYLLFRLYEAISAQMIRPVEDKMMFVDIPMDHPIIEDLNALKQAGAFTNLSLGHSFDGYSPVILRDLGDVIQGILAGRNETTQFDPRNVLGKKAAMHLPVNRGTMVLMLKHLLDVFQTAHPEQYREEYRYKDVKPASELDKALQYLQHTGINPGYPNHVLRPNEPITWFEFVGILKQTLSKLDLIRITRSEPDEAAQKSDFERYAAIIQAKQNRIRKILHSQRY